MSEPAPGTRSGPFARAVAALKTLFARYRAARGKRLAFDAGVAIVLLSALSLTSIDLNPLPNTADIEDTDLRKATFFAYLEPIAAERNAAILEQRGMLAQLAQAWQRKQDLSLFEEFRLKSLARQYDVEWNADQPASAIETLRRRVDAVPISLVLVQAAKESGWGTSRFAREGNNLFGQWCYTPGCGIVPSSRAGGAKHEVQVFDSVGDAIDAYLHNINTGDAYRSLREIRANLRRAGKIPDGKSLADGLLYYSQRREAYVQEVKLMLDQYRQFRQKQSG